MLETFFHDTTKKYVVLFGTLFNDIYINRETEESGVTETLKIPLVYSQKEKMHARLAADPELNRQPAIVLPAMGFELTGYNYDQTRKLVSTKKHATVIDPTTNARHLYEYNPVPYNLTFDLHIMAKNAVDGNRIVEQILPYFTPDFTPSVNLIPELGLTYDIPIILNNVAHEDTYEGSFEDRRTLTWTLSFTLKGYFFAPTKKLTQIKTAITNIFAVENGVDIDDAVGNTFHKDTITITPGVMANGAPTSNSSLSIDIGLINANSDYGFIIGYTSNYDN